VLNTRQRRCIPKRQRFIAPTTQCNNAKGGFHLAQLKGDRVEIAPDGRLLISVPLDVDIDHSITLG